MRKWSAKEIHDALKKRYCPPQWVYAKEFSMLTGWEYMTGLGRFVDGVAFNLWPSGKNGHVIIAFEIKVSRSDFRNELKDPKKREAAVKLADEFYFVTPKGMLRPEEIPHECGLIEVKEDGSARIRVRVPEPDWMHRTQKGIQAGRQNFARGLAAAIMRKMDPESMALRISRDLNHERYVNNKLESKVEKAKIYVKRALDDLRVV